LPKFDILKVTWKDHNSHSGYLDLDSLHYLNVSTQQSVGYLVREDKEAVYLAETLCRASNKRDSKACDDIVIIIKKCILNREVIGTSDFLEC
jgi:hypothetical protein